MEREKIVAFTRKITQSNRTELIVVLYDIFFAYLEDGMTANEEKNAEAARNSFRHAALTIRHLKDALDYAYDIAAELYPIYDFCERAVARSIYSGRNEGALEAKHLMEKLADAFRTIAADDLSEPMMQHTQKIMAGYTYGRNDLNETTENYDAQRGFLV